MHKSKADSPAARSLFGAFSRREKSWQSWQFGRKQIKKKFGHLTPNFDITNEQVSYHGLKKYLFTCQSGHLVWLATWKVAALTNALCPTLSNFAGRKKRSHKHSGGQGTVWQKKKKNLLPECLTKRLAYLQYTQWATTDVAQFKIHDSCQKTKEIQIRERGCNPKVVVHCPTVLWSRFDNAKTGCFLWQK